MRAVRKRKRKNKRRRRREKLRPRNIGKLWDILRCKPKIAANVLDFLVGEMLVDSMGKLIANRPEAVAFLVFLLRNKP